MNNNSKRYTPEFKADIVRLITEENRSVSSIVKDFGVSEQTVRNWLNESKGRKEPYKIRIAELEAELKETKKKLADSEVTIDILKKATAIFTQNNRK